MSRVGLKTCLMFLVACSVSWAAEEAERPVATGDQPPTAEAVPTPWHSRQNYIRPHKGVRADSDGRQIPSLMWVLTTERGQPLAITGLESPQVESYFNSRLEAKLTQLKQQYSLTALQVEKLRLAAQVDLARLQRFAQYIDSQLATIAVGQDERGVNKLFNSLATACDQRLFEDDSLLQRVLATQLQQSTSRDFP